MKRINKEELLRHHPEMSEEVFQILGSNIFVYLDLIFFSLFLGIILFAQIQTILLPILISLAFLCCSLILFKILSRYEKKTD